MRLWEPEQDEGQEGRDAAVDDGRPDGHQGRLRPFESRAWNNYEMKSAN